MTLFCIICGCSREEVKKLFCFPRNLERSKLWQVSIGMEFRYPISGHFRVCDRHFETNCFKPFMSELILRPDAIPTLLSIQPTEECQEMPSTPADSRYKPSTSCASHVPLSSVNICQELPSIPADIGLEPSTSSATHVPLSSVNVCQELPYVPADVDHEPSTSSASPVPLTSINICQELPSISASAGQLSTCAPSSFVPQPAPRLNKKSSFLKAIDSVSSREKNLISVIQRKDMYLKKLKKKCKERGAKIKDLSNIHNSVEVNNIFKGMSPTVANFMVAQIRCSKRLSHGRRWTLDDKIMSLAIYKRSPKCYTLLRRLLSLPSIRTLTSLLEKVPFGVGINEHIFSHLGECLNKFPETDRLCSLAFDEMALREHIQYNASKDCFEGIEDYGHYRTNKLANYALVFFAQGIAKPWKQPLAYYFSRGGMTSSELEVALKDVLMAMKKANIPVITTICDMGSANVKTLKNMGSDILNPYFTLQGKQIYNIFDIPHLLKCFRNLFRKYDILIPTISSDGSVQNLQARWADIEKAYEEDKRNPLIFRSLYKIKDSYLQPLRQNAMKVKVAAQTLSRSVAVYIFNLVKQAILPPRALATATFANDVDQLFDSFNASARKGPDGKPYKCLVTKESGHLAFWSEMHDKLKKWKFIRKPGDISGSNHWKPPSQIGWLHDLNVYPQIWNHLQSVGLDSMRTRALNQDGLENLFGAIRSGCGCNENPTVGQFVSSLKTQVINGLTNQGIKGTNCEEDNETLLSSLRSFLESGSEQLESKKPNMDLSAQPAYSKYSATDIEELVVTGSIESLSVAYVSGFIVKKLFTTLTCDICKNVLCSDNLDPCNQFIALKEFSSDKSKLFYPSEQLVVVVGQGITILEEKLSEIYKELDILKRAVNTLATQIDFSFLNICPIHCEYVKNSIIVSICRIGIPWYCKRIVRDIRSDVKKKVSERKQKKLQHV